MNIENTNQHIKHFTEPYSIWIIDNFFSNETLQMIKSEWPNLESEHWHKGHKYINNKKNILEQGMHAISKIDDVPEYTAKVLNYIHTDEFTNRMSEITNVNDLITDSSMRWSGLRTMTPGSFQAIHSDARKNPETGLRKELTCLVYLNDEYNKERDGGCFEVWNDDMTKCVHEIEPIDNRLVIFLNTDKSYHGVPEVKFERKAILWSILKDAELTDDRSKALFVSRPTDSDEIGKLGKERAHIKDAM
jgi:Rps23 Pro-64 3,4-dihydroxylase Tpa1-like proline 4-hydroxylase